MSLKKRWIYVVAATLLHPLLLIILFPVFGPVVNSISFVPAVVATVFLGLRIGLVTAVVSTSFATVFLYHELPVSAAVGIPRVLLSFGVTVFVSVGAYWARKTFFLQQEAQTELDRAEEQYRLIFENSAQGILCMDHHGVITDANRRALQQFELSEQQFGKINWSDIPLCSESFLSQIREQMALYPDGPFQDISTEIVRSNEETTCLDISLSFIERGNGLQWIWMIKDNTEKRQMEQQLAHAQRMEVMGRLAGGVAHDINNVLSAIMGASYSLNWELRRGGDVVDDLETITSACDQGAQLTQNLLGFVRKNQFRHDVFSVNRLVESVLALIRRTAPKNIQIETSLCSESIMMEGDPGTIESAVMNLCLNAVDAMEDSGVLKVKTRTKNGHFFLAVSDTGSGIDESIRSKVFEPFFTTKPVGKGTGLGLAMVHKAVKNHSGKICIESMAGIGTKMVMTFPRVKDADSHNQRVESSKWDGIESPLEGQTVLLVDDESIVLRAAQRLFSSLGAKVISTQRSTEALALYRQHHTDIHLVVLDLVMPEMDGTILLKALREVNPEVPALISSGFNPEPEKLHLLQSQIPRFVFLKKPYKAAEMLKCLERLGMEPTSAYEHRDSGTFQPQ